MTNKVFLNDLIKLKKGFAFESCDYSLSGTPVVRVSDFSKDSIVDDDIVYLQCLTDSYKEYRLKKDDILIQTVGSWENNPESVVGKVVRVPEFLEGSLLNQNIVKVIPNMMVDPNFLYYRMKLEDFKWFLLGSARGAANQASITLDRIRKFKLYLPDLNEQREKSAILKRYDDLIYIIQRQAEDLNNLIKYIYKLYFYQKNDKEVNDEIKILDIFTYQRGISYSTEEIQSGEGVYLVNLKNVKSYGGFRKDGKKKYSGKYNDKQIVKKGDLIMAVTDMTQDRRTVGYVAIVPDLKETAVISADLILLKSEINSRFLFSWFKYGNISKYVSEFANGSNVLHLRPETLSKIKVSIPNKDMIMNFVNKVNPLFDELEILDEQIDYLIEQRDMLLPHLIHRDMDVK